MKTEKTKGNGTKNDGTDFGCCNPENFKEMFEKMSKCFPGLDGSTASFAMKDNMMKKMMEMCCPSKSAGTKGDADLQKKQEGDTESTEKEGRTF